MGRGEEGGGGGWTEKMVPGLIDGGCAGFLDGLEVLGDALEGVDVRFDIEVVHGGFNKHSEILVKKNHCELVLWFVLIVPTETSG